MPTDTDDVRSSGQTGSEQSAVEPSL